MIFGGILLFVIKNMPTLLGKFSVFKQTSQFAVWLSCLYLTYAGG